MPAQTTNQQQALLLQEWKDTSVEAFAVVLESLLVTEERCRVD